ncbi:unnamed protein product [Sphagnum jensenii]|uniref:Uncharacterized protein n=1 Tax=Sphagnum jensenii TaxID=128206 RepID=A0ABP1AVE4_9BRYO
MIRSCYLSCKPGPTCLVCMLKRTGDPQLLRRTEVNQAATIAGATNARCISFSRVGNQERSQTSYQELQLQLNGAATERRNAT